LLRKPSNGLLDYVWVREATKKGYPHFHFVADWPQPSNEEKVQLSLLWSSYFGVEAKNAIRFGTDPKRPPRKFYIDSPQMAFYMSKYIGKTKKAADGTLTFKIRCMSPLEQKQERRPKVFFVSRKLSAKIQPAVYESQNVMLYSGKHVRQFTREIINPEGVPVLEYADDRAWSWKQCGIHSVWTGLKKRRKQAKKQKTTEN
jgi:hypothetical protein